MAQFGWQECPATARNQIVALIAALEANLGANLQGIYLHGSLAMGCFNPDRSDIDLLVTAHDAILPAIHRQIVGTLLQISCAPHPIEISIMSYADLFPWRHPASFQLHFSESWRDRYEQQMVDAVWEIPVLHDPDLAAHVTVTRARGICLAGPPIAEVFPVIPRDDYVASICGDVEDARQHMRGNPVYFILNACRVAAYLRDGMVRSKDEGGVWALHALPAIYHPLTAYALAVYRGEMAEGVFDEAELERFARFV
jgi:predicted nucleotidyltransferase